MTDSSCSSVAYRDDIRRRSDTGLNPDIRQNIRYYRIAKNSDSNEISNMRDGNSEIQYMVLLPEHALFFFWPLTSNYTALYPANTRGRGSRATPPSPARCITSFSYIGTFDLLVRLPIPIWFIGLLHTIWKTGIHTLNSRTRLPLSWPSCCAECWPRNSPHVTVLR